MNGIYVTRLPIEDIHGKDLPNKEFLQTVITDSYSAKSVFDRFGIRYDINKYSEDIQSNYLPSHIIINCHLIINYVILLTMSSNYCLYHLIINYVN